MTRDQLEHIIRAASSIANDPDIVVIGSQSVLGQHPDAPAALLVSNEADVYPRNHPERADLVEGSIGEESPFHETYGYYAQAVDETTASLPRGWQARLYRINNANTMGASGWCLDLHDLLIAKLVAGRDKDLAYIAAAARNAMVDPDTLRARLADTSIDDPVRAVAVQRLERYARTGPATAPAAG